MAEETRPGAAAGSRAGEKMFVDYAGATIPIHDPQSGAVHPAAVFVAVLGQQLHLRRGHDGQDLRNWIGSHMRPSSFSWCGRVVVPDNLKSAVTHPATTSRSEPHLPRSGEHYGVAIIPARLIEPGTKPRQRWRSGGPALDCSCLAQAQILLLDEVNQAIAELLTRLNQRRSANAKAAAPACSPTGPAGAEAVAGHALPVRSMEDGGRQHRLSHRGGAALLQVPYALVHQKVDVHLTAETLEVLHRGCG